ncbi:hypothetical protein F5Y15DRAFT_78269 [Xylariaceae sp. FL0016]|nr:hypothetical protein F5Y15DRAFT_78269 [Xylariaceae sp. FL0016]
MTAATPRSSAQMDLDDELELTSNGDGELHSTEDQEPATPVSRPTITRSQAWNLYVSHAFSTWNARGYEFAAVLFTAAAYPGTLAVAAGRMIIVYFAMILFSSSVGQWVQRSPDRLRTLLSTIICNRGTVILGSFFWLLILSQEDLVGDEATFVLPKNDVLKGIGFTTAVTLGIVERLSASGNMISMERDWVVTIAAPAGMSYDLTDLNAVMRRIDLVCKLISPILISIVISAVGSTRVGVIYTGLTSLVSIPIETLSAKRVWKSSSLLQTPRPVTPQQAESGISTQRTTWRIWVHHEIKSFRMYFTSSVWVPSVALALLHFNMLTWRATFITYLINVGYSLAVITIARGIGSLFEITSTVLTPRGIRLLGKTGYRRSRRADDYEESGVGLMSENQEGVQDAETLTGLQRVGLWGISWQSINTVPVVLALWAISAQFTESDSLSGFSRSIMARTVSLPIAWSLILFSFLAMSRLGVWVFDLSTQQLTQTLVPAHQRSSFAGVENSIVNMFEVLGAGVAIAFPETEQYGWLALASLAAVAISWLMYAGWVRSQRGHLVHWDKLGFSRPCN